MARLGDLYQITSGGTPSRKHLDYYQDGTIPWVKTGDLKEKYLRATDEKITEIGLKNSSARIYPQDTVLIAMYGATIGASSILKIEAATNQACAAFVKRDDVIPEYLYAFLESQQSRFIKDAVGGAQPNISAGYLKQIDMPLIPVEEQRRIAALLDKVSDLIDKRRAQLDKLDLLVKARFVEMFGDCKANPKCWDTCCLEDIAEVGSSKRVFVEELKEEGIPFYRGTEVGALAEGVTITPELFITEEHYEELCDMSGKPQKGDLLMPSICPDGRIWLVDTDNPFYFKAQVINDKHLKLLEVIAEDIGYKEVRWDDIKQYYYPVGLSNLRQDEAILRRVQIDAGLAQINESKKHGESSQTDANNQMATQVLIEAMKNPDGLLKLMEVAERAQNFNKGPQPRK